MPLQKMEREFSGCIIIEFNSQNTFFVFTVVDNTNIFKSK